MVWALFFVEVVLSNRNGSGACAACITIVRVVFMSNAVSRPMSCLAKLESISSEGPLLEAAVAVIALAMARILQQ